jgi:hypothetical protein
MDHSTKAMYDILNKLNTVDSTARMVAESAEQDVDLKVALTQKIEENSVSVQNYRIDIVLQEFAGTQKHFYNVVEDNKILYRELALFETAMGVVKKLMTGKSGADEIVRYDEEYINNLYEVYTHKHRIKTGTINEDIAQAKLDRAKTKLKESKDKILRRL